MTTTKQNFIMKSTKINLVIILIFTISLTIITSCNKENVEASIEEEIYNPVFPKTIDIEIENTLTFQELADTVEYYNGEEGFYNLVLTEPVQVISVNSDKIAENSEIIFDTENNTIFNDILTNIEELKNTKEEQLKIDIAFDGNYTVFSSIELQIIFNNEQVTEGEISEIIYTNGTNFTATDTLYLAHFNYLYNENIPLQKGSDNTLISFDWGEHSTESLDYFMNIYPGYHTAIPSNGNLGQYLSTDTINNNIHSVFNFEGNNPYFYSNGADYRTLFWEGDGASQWISNQCRYHFNVIEPRFNAGEHDDIAYYYYNTHNYLDRDSLVKWETQFPPLK